MRARYEYKILTASTMNVSEKHLNALGAEGWLMITIAPAKNDGAPEGAYLLYLVRSVNGNPRDN